MTVLLGNALVSVALEIVLLVRYARAARRASRVRHHGPGAMAHTALTRPVITLTCVCGAYRVCTRSLLLRWVGQIVRRAGGSAGASGSGVG